MTFPRLRMTQLIVAVLLLSGLLIVPVAAEDADAVDQPEETGTELGGNTFRIFAHPEGLVGHTTANGHTIQPEDFFVALPCFCVLSSKGGSEFEVLIEYEGNSLVVPVWDVGPWNVDDNYWDPPEERRWPGLPRGVPQAYAAYNDGYNGGLDGWDRKVLTQAGMDIADGAFHALGMTSSDWVNVTFLWQEDGHSNISVADSPSPFPDIDTYYWDERPPLDSVEPNYDDRYDYVVETGHNVPEVMMDYWWSHGNWFTQGLPISEFFREIEADGSVRYVQFFERTILSVSWDPDTGDPHVTADNLGYETYIDPAAREPIPWFPDDDYAMYFSETGHSLGGGFRHFYFAHGGYEVFGAPLSEEWGTTNRDGRKVVKQVFERGRFEWWPDMVGTGEEITLGLISTELLQRAGLMSAE